MLNRNVPLLLITFSISITVLAAGRPGNMARDRSMGKAGTGTGHGQSPADLIGRRNRELYQLTEKTKRRREALEVRETAKTGLERLKEINFTFKKTLPTARRDSPRNYVVGTAAFTINGVTHTLEIKREKIEYKTGDIKFEYHAFLDGQTIIDLLHQSSTDGSFELTSKRNEPITLELESGKPGRFNVSITLMPPHNDTLQVAVADRLSRTKYTPPSRESALPTPMLKGAISTVASDLADSYRTAYRKGFDGTVLAKMAFTPVTSEQTVGFTVPNHYLFLNFTNDGE